MKIYNNLYSKLKIVKIKQYWGNFNFEKECKWRNKRSLY